MLQAFTWNINIIILYSPALIYAGFKGMNTQSYITKSVHFIYDCISSRLIKKTFKDKVNIANLLNFNPGFKANQL